jgi:hypothetical protein
MTTSSPGWETVSCPLCGAADDRDFLRTTGDDGVEYRLGRCAACEMVFVNPRPDETSIARFYPEDYAPYRPSRKRSGGFLRALRARIGAAGEKTLSDRIPVRPGGVLMDYGCGGGGSPRGCGTAGGRRSGWTSARTPWRRRRRTSG